VVATPTEVKVIDDGDALFDRHPQVQEYDDYYVSCMLNDAKRGQTGIGYVVNAITWFNLLWLNRENIVAELRQMQPSSQVAAAILWMEEELPRSRMPMVASRLEEIIDAIKLNGSSINWVSGVITEFRETLSAPVRKHISCAALINIGRCGFVRASTRGLGCGM
jgi:FAD/FMN-containing dehydrogenase